MRVRLVALCVALTVGEALAAWVFKVPGGLAIAPQVGAPPPLGLFQDLRWLFVYERSWTGFALEAAGVLAARTAVTYFSLSWSWPARSVRPAAGRLAARSAIFTVVSALVLSPFALLLFAFAAFPVSWLFYAAFPAVVVLALMIHGASVSRSSWRALPPLLAVGWLALTILLLSVLGALGNVPTARGPALAVGLVVAVAAGVVDAFAWSRIVAAVVLRSPPRVAVPVPLFAAVFLVVSFVGVKVGFAAARQTPASAEGPSPASSVARGDHAVLVASGFSSHWSGTPVRFAGERRDEVAQPFSYRGTGPSGAPLHYGAADTQRPIGELAGLMAAQVRTLAQRTGHRVTVIGESEGSVIVEDYLRRFPHAPVGLAVVVSPLVHPGSVTYPIPGADGWGVAAGAGLSLIGDALRPLATIDLAPTDPFLRSLVTTPLGPGPLPSARAGWRSLVIVPIADSVASVPARQGRREDVMVIPGFHGGNLVDPAAVTPIVAALDGRSPRASSALLVLGHLIEDLASGWHVPSLRSGLAA